MRLLWLPSVLRGAGLTVHEVSGWQTRGNDSFGPVVGITCHHTAGSRTATPQAEINVLLRGSNTAPPPIAQLSLDRRGEWYVVASGLCFHNLVGWAGPNRGVGNDGLIGIEAMHSGGDEPWTPRQYESYVRGVAALVRHLEISVARVAGHKEHQPGSKFDPTFNMDRFRADVRETLEDDMSWSQPLDGTSSTESRFGPGDIRADTLLKLAAIYAYDGAKAASRADAKVEALTAVIEQLAATITAGGGSVDTAAILAGVDERLAALPERVADAVIDEIAS